MKISFFEGFIDRNKALKDKSKNGDEEDKEIKGIFKALTFVFVITVIAVVSIFSKFNITLNNKNENAADYVSVFKESDIHQMLFELNENE